ncbi:hypothetical protein T440DRAFT_536007 [Plenodomus tracheiphilus IPT5]|uniref:F-box domain-containing protein n=1 Tax=Plenodomus tracheiphilus IPT5 TaxID=1408161 RepID=A0A6A7BNT5_9PLEO|nr:hypothetical protein T440DRAFT_536007 [Plenodomus tracheiphilus IPT5]
MGNLFSSPSADDWKSDVRYAMESGAFCVICGGPFDIEGNVYGIDPKDPRYDWLNNFRLLGNITDVAASKIASENASATNDSAVKGMFLSERAWFSMSESQYLHVPSQDNLGDIWFDTPSYTSNAGTLFPLHEACISLGCKVIENLRLEPTDRKLEPALSVLSQLLNASFRTRYAGSDVADDTRNDLFDLCKSSDEKGPRSVLAMTRLEWWGGEYDRFYANPLDEVNTSPFVLTILQASPHMELEQSQTWVSSRKPTTLEGFPPELVDLICDYLSARSVVALHRTSKALAMKTPMNNKFWRDSLRDGSLHPHLWDLDTKWIEHGLQQSRPRFLDPTAAFDWKGVAQILFAASLANSDRDPRMKDLPHHLWNRCRIWNIIKEALVDEEMH